MSFKSGVVSDNADILISISTDPCPISQLFQNSGMKENAAMYWQIQTSVIRIE